MHRCPRCGVDVKIIFTPGGCNLFGGGGFKPAAADLVVAALEVTPCSDCSKAPSGLPAEYSDKQ